MSGTRSRVGMPSTTSRHDPEARIATGGFSRSSAAMTSRCAASAFVARRARKADRRPALEEEVEPGLVAEVEERLGRAEHSVHRGAKRFELAGLPAGKDRASPGHRTQTLRRNIRSADPAPGDRRGSPRPRRDGEHENERRREQSQRQRGARQARKTSHAAGRATKTPCITRWPSSARPRAPRMARIANHVAPTAARSVRERPGTAERHRRMVTASARTAACRAQGSASPKSRARATVRALPSRAIGTALTAGSPQTSLIVRGNSRKEVREEMASPRRAARAAREGDRHQGPRRQETPSWSLRRSSIAARGARAPRRQRARDDEEDAVLERIEERAAPASSPAATHARRRPLRAAQTSAASPANAGICRSDG